MNSNPAAIAFLRRMSAAPADIADGQLLRAVVHIALAGAAPVTEFCANLACLLGPTITLRAHDGSPVG